MRNLFQNFEKSRLEKTKKQKPLKISGDLKFCILINFVDLNASYSPVTSFVNQDDQDDIELNCQIMIFYVDVKKNND